MMAVRVQKHSNLSNELEVAGYGREPDGVHKLASLRNERSIVDITEMSSISTKEPSPNLSSREFQEHPSWSSEASPLPGESQQEHSNSLADELQARADTAVIQLADFAEEASYSFKSTMDDLADLTSTMEEAASYGLKSTMEDLADTNLANFAEEATSGLTSTVKGLAESSGEAMMGLAESGGEAMKGLSSGEATQGFSETFEGLRTYSEEATIGLRETIEGLAEYGQSVMTRAPDGNCDEDGKQVRFVEKRSSETKEEPRRRRSLAQGLQEAADSAVGGFVDLAVEASQSLREGMEGLAEMGEAVLDGSDSESGSEEDVKQVRFADEINEQPKPDRRKSLVDGFADAVDSAVNGIADFAEGFAETVISGADGESKSKEKGMRKRNSSFAPTSSEESSDDEMVDSQAHAKEVRRQSLAESLAEAAEIAVSEFVEIAGDLADYGQSAVLGTEAIDNIEASCESSESVSVFGQSAALHDHKDEGDGGQSQIGHDSSTKPLQEPVNRFCEKSSVESLSSAADVGGTANKTVRLLSSDDTSEDSPHDPITFKRMPTRKRQSVAQSLASSSSSANGTAHPLKKMQAVVRGALIASGVVASGSKLLRETRRPFRELIIDDSNPLRKAVTLNGKQPVLTDNERCQLSSYLLASCEAVAKKLSIEENRLWDSFIHSDHTMTGVLHVQSNELRSMLTRCFGESDRIDAWVGEISFVADENQEIDFADLLDWHHHAQKRERLWSFWSVARASLGASVSHLGKEITSVLRGRFVKMSPRELLDASIAYRRSFMLTSCWQCEQRVKHILWNGGDPSSDVDSGPPPSPMMSLLAILRIINSELNSTERVIWEIVGSKGKFFGAAFTRQDLLAGIGELLVYTLERELSSTPSKDFEELQQLRNEAQRRSVDSLFYDDETEEEKLTVTIVDVIDWWWDMPEQYRIAAGLTVPDVLLQRSAHRQPEEMFKEKLKGAVTNQSVAHTALRGHIRAYAQLKALAAKCEMQNVLSCVAEAESEVDV